MGNICGHRLWLAEYLSLSLGTRYLISCFGEQNNWIDEASKRKSFYIIRSLVNSVNRRIHIMKQSSSTVIKNWLRLSEPNFSERPIINNVCMRDLRSEGQDTKRNWICQIELGGERYPGKDNLIFDISLNKFKVFGQNKFRRWVDRFMQNGIDGHIMLDMFFLFYVYHTGDCLVWVYKSD